MVNVDRKHKMISIRLSEMEYQFLKTQYESFGVRNVSDLARLAVQRIMDGSPAGSNTHAEKLVDLDNRVRTLEAQITAMAQRNWAEISSYEAS